MGTRHLIAVQLDGEYKIAQYGQWDGYPEGQGVTVLSFLQAADLDQFKDRLRQLSWITEEEHKQRWVDVGAEPDSDFVSMDIAAAFKQRWPELSRDTGADILRLVQQSDHPLKLQNQIDFAKDSLFCEWAYVIDFDAGVFEVWKGFQKERVEDGRFPGPVVRDYGPVQLVHSWPLSELPASNEAFLVAFEDNGEEEAAA